MRRIAPLFNGVVESVEFWVTGCHTVDEQEYPAGFQNTRHFMHKPGYIGKMVRSDATGDTVESSGRERQVLGIGHLEHRVPYTLCQQILARFFEHARRQVGNGHLCHMRHNCQGRLSTTGSDIKRPQLRTPLTKFDESLQVIPGAVCETGNIALRRAPKVILYPCLLLIAVRLCHIWLCSFLSWLCSFSAVILSAAKDLCVRRARP